MRTSTSAWLLAGWISLITCSCAGSVGNRGSVEPPASKDAGSPSKPYASGANDAGGMKPASDAGSSPAPSDAGVDARASDAGQNTPQDASPPITHPVMNEPPVLGPPGTWNDVTPLAAGLTIGDFGVQTMLADPARASDFYFVSSATPGVFKSTDYGKTWSKIASASLTYGCACDPNFKRDPKTPLTLWCGGGYGNGVGRSTDSGVTWKMYKMNNAAAGDFGNDPYAFDVDPYDSTHVIAGFHGSPGMSESLDGGETWKDIAIPSDAGVSLYPYFIDTGVSTSTRGNWLTHSQWGDNGGLQRSTDAGASWKRVDSLQHGHGNSQVFQAGNGVMYAAGLDGSKGHGIYRSSDYGMTWTLVNDGTPQNGVFGTSNYIYADYGWASGGGQDQQPQRSPRNTGTLGSWEKYAPDAKLKNGSGHAAVSRNPSTGKWVIVIGAWTGGVYRYEEP